MSGAHAHLRAYLWLILVLLLFGIVFFFFVKVPTSQTPAVSMTTGTTAPPAPTASDYVSAQQSFQYLVSYTVSGFHPTTLAVKTGQTIRFTNNSPDQISIQGPGGRSSLLSQSAYWQYTATSTGSQVFKAGNSAITVAVTK